MAPDPTLPLAGRGVLITRPAAQAAHLAALVSGSGGRPIVFPAVEIADIEDSAALTAVIDALDAYDLAVFVSPTAAEKGWNAVRRRRGFPGHLKVAAVGRGTARALERLGIPGVIVPARGADSAQCLDHRQNGVKR